MAAQATPPSDTPPASGPLGLDLGAFEDAAQRVRDLNERVIESSKSAGLTALDAYEKSLKGLVDFEHKVAGASQLDWVTALAETHAKVIQNVSAAYTKAARGLLD
jgi:hypothetical protein